MTHLNALMSLSAAALLSAVAFADTTPTTPAIPAPGLEAQHCPLRTGAFGPYDPCFSNGARETGRFHKNGGKDAAGNLLPGGFVSLNALVDDSAVVEKDACICARAKVTQKAKVLGFAIVGDNAVVSGEAVVKDNAVVGGNAQIKDKAEVAGGAWVDDMDTSEWTDDWSGTAVKRLNWDTDYPKEKITGPRISGGAHIAGSAIITQNAQIKDFAFITDHARVYGAAKVEGIAVVDKDARVYGKALVSDHRTGLIVRNSRVSQYAEVYDNAQLTWGGEAWGRSKVYGNAIVTNSSMVDVKARVFGNAKLLNESKATGNVRIHGNKNLDGDIYDHGEYN